MRMKQMHVYSLDLTKIEGKGDFPCPECGNVISSDDESEETYSILEPKVNSHGLDELVIRCNSCTSHIHLTGFLFLQKLPGIDEERLENKEEKETIAFIAHV